MLIKIILTKRSFLAHYNGQFFKQILLVTFLPTTKCKFVLWKQKTIFRDAARKMLVKMATSSDKFSAKIGSNLKETRSVLNYCSFKRTQKNAKNNSELISSRPSSQKSVFTFDNERDFLSKCWTRKWLQLLLHLKSIQFKKIRKWSQHF